jgi:hypothetical protein
MAFRKVSNSDTYQKRDHGSRAKNQSVEGIEKIGKALITKGQVFSL